MHKYCQQHAWNRVETEPSQQVNDEGSVPAGQWLSKWFDDRVHVVQNVLNLHLCEVRVELEVLAGVYFVFLYWMQSVAGATLSLTDNEVVFLFDGHLCRRDCSLLAHKFVQSVVAQVQANVQFGSDCFLLNFNKIMMIIL